MFERFTDEARAVVVEAQSQARELRDPSISSGHLLLAMLGREGREGREGRDGRDGLAGQLLADRAVTAAWIRGRLAGDVLDPEALATLGIDLDEVRRAAEEQFGPGALGRAVPMREVPRGHIPFTKEAKKVLALAVREAVRVGSERIDSVHLLLGMLRADGEAVRLLRGVDLDRLRSDAEELAARRAA